MLGKRRVAYIVGQKLVMATLTISLFILGVSRFELFEDSWRKTLVYEVRRVGADDAGALA
jgi:hypothetical protein